MNTMAQAQSIAQTIIDGLDSSIRVRAQGATLVAEGSGISVQANSIVKLTRAVAEAWKAKAGIIERDSSETDSGAKEGEA